MACSIDFSALPILTGCPGANEQILVGNAIGGLDQNGGYTTGYGRRVMSTLISCILNSQTFVPFQFTIGQPGAPLSAGQTTFSISPPSGKQIIQDSVVIVLGGVVMDRNDSSQFSYTLQYNNPTAGAVTITFNDVVQNTQTFIVMYAYA